MQFESSDSESSDDSQTSDDFDRPQKKAKPLPNMPLEELKQQLSKTLPSNTVDDLMKMVHDSPVPSNNCRFFVKASGVHKEQVRSMLVGL